MPKNFDIDGDMPVAQDGVGYGIYVNRGQPLLITHIGCIRQIYDNAMEPLIMIGSTNEADKFFCPIENPLRADQRRQQLEIALAEHDIVEYKIFELPDMGDVTKWANAIKNRVEGEGIESHRCVFSYFLKEEVNKTTTKEVGIAPLANYLEQLKDISGVNVLRLRNNDEKLNDLLALRNEKADEISASKYRRIDLFTTDDVIQGDLREKVVALDFIRSLAASARNENPDGALLTEMGIPVTMLDLSLDRLRKEAEVSTQSLISKVDCSSNIYDQVVDYAQQEAREFRERKRQEEARTMPLHSGSAAVKSDNGVAVSSYR